MLSFVRKMSLSRLMYNRSSVIKSVIQTQVIHRCTYTVLHVGKRFLRCTIVSDKKTVLQTFVIAPQSSLWLAAYMKNKAYLFPYKYGLPEAIYELLWSLNHILDDKGLVAPSFHLLHISHEGQRISHSYWQFHLFRWMKIMWKEWKSNK